jgi:hypothetical protein
MKLLLNLIALISISASMAQSPYEIIDAVSSDRIEQDIVKLVSFGTRHTMSETESDTRGIGAARRWIKSEFEKISAECGDCLEVSFQRT